MSKIPYDIGDWVKRSGDKQLREGWAGAKHYWANTIKQLYSDKKPTGKKINKSIDEFTRESDEVYEQAMSGKSSKRQEQLIKFYQAMDEPGRIGMRSRFARAGAFKACR